MVDAESGQQVGPVLSGSSHDINILPQLLAAERGRMYGHLHTHPLGSSFSDRDAAVLLSWPGMRVIVVAAVAGAWYAMSRLDGGSVADPVEVVTEFRTALADLLDDPSIPGHERPHAIWTRIAAPLGLRYDRAGVPD